MFIPKVGYNLGKLSELTVSKCYRGDFHITLVIFWGMGSRKNHVVEAIVVSTFNISFYVGLIEMTC